MHQVKIEQFEGPLALLLDLVLQEKLEITEVSIAQVAEQYLLAIEANKERIMAAELADFLLVAAKLLLLKSRALLPELAVGREEGETNLAQQLKIYKIYRDASRNLGNLIAAGNFSFYRAPAKFTFRPEFAPPAGLRAGDLQKVFAEIIRSARAGLHILEKKKITRVFSLNERIAQLRLALAKVKQIEFSDWLRSARNKSEIIVSFLALLELIKQKQIFIEERNSDIYVFIS